MFAGFMALQPLIRYGIIAGVIATLVGSIWFHGYFEGRAQVKQAWDAAIAEQSANSVREAVKADAMESQVVKSIDQAERAVKTKAEKIRKEVLHENVQDQKPLSDAVVAIYDRLISLPNEAGHSLPPADPSAGTPEVSRGGLATETLTRVQIDDDGEEIELTTEELKQAAIDFAVKYALMKNAFKGFNDWNEGREHLELERLPKE